MPTGCLECGKNMSSSAKWCPHCGYVPSHVRLQEQFDGLEKLYESLPESEREAAREFHAKGEGTILIVFLIVMAAIALFFFVQPYFYAAIG